MTGLRNCMTGAVLAAGLMLCAPASAQTTIRAGEAYTHPHSGIVIPATLGGIDRSAANTYADDFLDMSIGFEVPGEALTVYVFRKTNADVPVWFAQAQAGLQSREGFENARLAFAPEAFTPPGQPNASGLQAVYALSHDGWQSTGLALFEVDGWYVKIRSSSRSRSPEATLGWLDDVIGALGLPEGDAPVAVPVEDCADELRFRGNSRDVRGDGMASVLGSLLGSAVSAQVQSGEIEAESVPVVWCREAVLEPTQVAYRANGSTDSYLLALGDNGNAVRVAPDSIGALLAEEGGDEPMRWSLGLVTAARTINITPQDRLPRPRRVMQLIDRNSFVGSVSTWGDESDIQIDADAL